MVELWEPDMNESIYREIFHELYRFPYLQDKYRNEATVDKIIGEAFNSLDSVPMEYPGGYLVLRRIGRGTADLFWIHLRGKLRHRWVRLGAWYLDRAMRIFGIRRLTMRTADGKVARTAKLLGFKDEMTDRGGFVWHGETMPMFHLLKEN